MCARVLFISEIILQENVLTIAMELSLVTLILPQSAIVSLCVMEVTLVC